MTETTDGQCPDSCTNSVIKLCQSETSPTRLQGKLSPADTEWSFVAAVYLRPCIGRSLLECCWMMKPSPFTAGVWWLSSPVRERSGPTEIQRSSTRLCLSPKRLRAPQYLGSIKRSKAIRHLDYGRPPIGYGNSTDANGVNLMVATPAGRPNGTILDRTCCDPKDGNIRTCPRLTDAYGEWYLQTSVSSGKVWPDCKRIPRNTGQTHKRDKVPALASTKRQGSNIGMANVAKNPFTRCQSPFFPLVWFPISFLHSGSRMAPTQAVLPLNRARFLMLQFNSLIGSFCTFPSCTASMPRPWAVTSLSPFGSPLHQLVLLISPKMRDSSPGTSFHLSIGAPLLAPLFWLLPLLITPCKTFCSVT